MIKLNKKQNNMKTTEKKLKLIDILRGALVTNEENALIAQSEQGNINTQQEILDLKGKIIAQDAAINASYQNNPFSATKVFVARKEKQLLENKLAELQKIQAEMF